MAGGLFGQPFVFNIKCIIFSLIIMGLFLLKPSFSSNYTLYATLFVIFVLSYVAMAWYDAFFDCRILPLKRGKYSGTKLLKPDTHVPEKQEEGLCEEDKTKKMILIYLAHLLFIAPLVGYVAIYKGKANKIVYPILGVLSLFTLGYHGSSLLMSSHK